MSGGLDCITLPALKLHGQTQIKCKDGHFSDSLKPHAPVVRLKFMLVVGVVLLFELRIILRYQ
jgi:hypothetical protein